MKTRLATLAMLLALLGVVAAGPLQAASAQPAAGGAATITNTTGTVLGTVSNLAASFDRATGLTTITGTFTSAAGDFTNNFTTTLQSASGTCQILDLVLGPINLNLLGAVVTLNQVHLNITAQSGSGQLLGNLLCAVAHLLDSNASGNALANLLNQIFALL